MNNGYYNGYNQNDYYEDSYTKDETKKAIIMFILSLLACSLFIFLIVKNNGSKYYVVVIDSNTGIGDVVVKNVKRNTKLTVPQEPVREGFIFEGWYDKDGPYDFDRLVKSDLKLKAHWKIDDGKAKYKGYVDESTNKAAFSVRFDPDGGELSVKEVMVLSGEKVNRPANPTKDGYVFVEWIYKDEPYDFDKPVTENMTLIAKWNKVNEVNYYTVTFDYGYSGSQKKSEKVIDGGYVSEPVNPTRKGYTFLGWYNGSEEFDFDKPIKSNITLVAKWESNSSGSVKTITIRFELNDGTGNYSTQSIISGGKVSQPSDPTRKGYSFGGWYNGNTRFDFSKSVTSNLTLKAKWIKEETTKYTITFDSNGGSSVSSQTIPSGGKATKPSNPTRSGYDFDGWYNGNTEFDFINTVINKNYTLTAKWTPKTNVSPSSVTVPTLSYSMNTTGKWIFVNNPWNVKDENLANNSRRLLFRDTFSGNLEIFYSHTFKDLSSPGYYAIRFWNPGDSKVTIKINKAGAQTNDSTGFAAWRSYYNGTKVVKDQNGYLQTSIVVPAKTVVYFYHNGNGFVAGHPSKVEDLASPMRTAFEGVLNITASGQLDIGILAYSGTYRNTDGIPYTGNFDEAISVYTGTYSKMPILTSNLNFEINDSVKKDTNLKVKYNGKEYSSWTTNSTGGYLTGSGTSYTQHTLSDVYKEDTVKFSIKTVNNGTQTVGPYPEYKDSRSKVRTSYGLNSRNYNLANWGVHYKENITIRNTGKTSRTVEFRIKNGSKRMGDGCKQTIIAYTTTLNTYNLPANNYAVPWTATIGPGDSITMPIEITLAGNSCGCVEKYIYVSK